MSILRFELTGEQNNETVATDISLALFAAECVYGKPRVRLEASYVVADDGSACVLKASGEAGEVAARVFAGLTAARLGEAAYSVKRVEELHS
jgi:hypothetical protein